MGLLLIPSNYHSKFRPENPTNLNCTSSSTPATAPLPLQHESNRKTFDTIMSSLRTQMLINGKLSSFEPSSFFPYGNPASVTTTRGSSGSKLPWQPSLLDEEEHKLIEKAKLLLVDEGSVSMTHETKQQLIQDILLASVVELEECCEDCLHRYNAINMFINKNPIEFNEFVSSLNCLDSEDFKTITSDDG